MAFLFTGNEPSISGDAIGSVFFSSASDVFTLDAEIGWWVNGQGNVSQLGTRRDVQSFSYTSTGRPAIITIAVQLDQFNGVGNTGNITTRIEHNIFNQARAELVAGQTHTDFDGAGTNGSFESGSGGVVGEILTLQDGTTILVEAVDGSGIVTEFEITTTDPLAVYADPFHRQLASSTGSLSGFVLIPDLANLRPALTTLTDLKIDTFDEAAAGARKFGTGNFDFAAFKNFAPLTTLIRPSQGDRINLGSTVRRTRTEVTDTGNIEVGRRWIQILELEG